MKHIQKLNEIAASNTTKTLQPVHILPAEPESAEHELQFTPEEAAAMVDVTANAAHRGLDAALLEEELYPSLDQSPESAQLDELIANSGSSRVAVIPAVDRVVDVPRVQEPIDLRIGGNHYKNPS